MRITFLGGVGTVTGSKFLLETGSKRLLIDCGLFQGYKQLRLKNWQPFPLEAGSIDAVVLTHAHLDHSGYLPLLVRSGFSGPAYATEATADLLQILLRDSAYLLEREAEYANDKGFSKHDPALPLYTTRDAERALERLRTCSFDTPVSLNDATSLFFQRAGHILGASILTVSANGKRIVFSGDLGRPDSATMPDPETIESADALVLESTYGNRLHGDEDPEDALADVITRTSARGGSVIIPSFAVGRSQSILYYLHRLKSAKRIPDLPIYLDSPMAIDATEIFLRHPDDHRLTAAEAKAAFGVARYVHTAEESRALAANHVPKVIVSASGMATGGRIVHHLKVYARDSRNTILFAGYQAGGTRGAAMIAGAQEIKIHGSYIPVRAEVDHLDMLSAHADSAEIMNWLSHFHEAPRQTFIVHGEAEASDALRHRVEEKLGWKCSVPEYRNIAEID